MVLVSVPGGEDAPKGQSLSRRGALFGSSSEGLGRERGSIIGAENA